MHTIASEQARIGCDPTRPYACEAEIEQLLRDLETAIGEGGLVVRWLAVRDRS
jgi:hypothetical protein